MHQAGFCHTIFFMKVSLVVTYMKDVLFAAKLYENFSAALSRFTHGLVSLDLIEETLQVGFITVKPEIFMPLLFS